MHSGGTTHFTAARARGQPGSGVSRPSASSGLATPRSLTSLRVAFCSLGRHRGVPPRACTDGRLPKEHPRGPPCTGVPDPDCPRSGDASLGAGLGCPLRATAPPAGPHGLRVFGRPSVAGVSRSGDRDTASGTSPHRSCVPPPLRIDSFPNPPSAGTSASGGSSCSGDGVEGLRCGTCVRESRPACLPGCRTMPER